MTIERVVVWHCGNVHCNVDHLTEKEARYCVKLWSEDRYQCPVCKKLCYNTISARECCSIEAHQEDLRAEVAYLNNPDNRAFRWQAKMAITLAEQRLEQCIKRVKAAKGEL